MAFIFFSLSAYVSVVHALTNSQMYAAASRGGVDVFVRGGRAGGGAMGEEGSGVVRCGNFLLIWIHLIWI
jgi:hypothetical protein